MAEIIQKDGTWAFDGDTLRLTPGRDRGVSLLRRTLGELTVPLGALAGISFEQGRKSGRLRLRLRDGADPLLQATGGRLAESDDPFRLTVESDRYGVAEYLADEVRTAIVLDQVPSTPAESYLLPGPSVPLSVSAGDGTASFDGERVRLEWNWKTEEAKSAGGARTLAVTDITAVTWQPTAGLENGYLRFTVRGSETKAPPKYDPHAVELWGFKKDPLMALVAAAVQARLPHPAAPVDDVRPAGKQLTLPAQAPPPAVEDAHDALLRRLRELGDLHRAGVLTDEEFTTAKQAVLKRM
ncbi:DUF4429 domain-containing protein [Streptomyces sp. NPDC093228]|uniref:DUF4429 domain-containing protein n=1 Tax=unclassified Streptomyces TaxID=2593676 RepID=UPI000741110F|nr:MULTISPECIES: DUF4429 domain-containing protein [unclassified Streptomyces]KUJ43656.1 Tat pathway signal sequence domain protein [Streptomyces sp. NRRL F-5122]MDX3262478.1 DUF4429 domain-containing protein [Streptomyces sp. MI02-2A]REE60942.1 putative oligomerization/nucleic acid binding protein [Streptomyces sp. 3212.3]